MQKKQSEAADLEYPNLFVCLIKKTHLFTDVINMWIVDISSQSRFQLS
jgi:hypothetical protein